METTPLAFTGLRKICRYFAAAIVGIGLISSSLSGCSGSGKELPKIGPNTTDPHWIKQHEPRANIALVFVHGIFGDAVGTWTGKTTSFFDLIENDSAMAAKVDMFAFGYTSKMLGEGSFGIDEAANTLYARLEAEGVLDYPAIVFVNHSMGGLVVLQMLYQHKDILPRVPSVILYSTPQSGADITHIAQYISSNEALGNMLPGDSNAFIRVLNDNWKAIDQEIRPHVHCAYEKEDTGGIRIVDWASATRFCDGNALAIAADHIDIVKPDRAKHDSFLVLQRALKPLLEKNFQAKLETPDFVIENGQPILKIDNPFGIRKVKIKNAGGGDLTYSFEQWPDGLHLAPSAHDRLLVGDSTDTLEVLLVWGTTQDQYKFVLSSSVTEPQTVLVRIPNLQAFRAQQSKLTEGVLSALSAQLSDPQKVKLLRDVSSQQAQASIVATVRDALGDSDATGSDAMQWIRTAEILAAVNWPELGAVAIQNAQKAEPNIVSTPSVRLLAASTASLAGRESIAGVPALPEAALANRPFPKKTPFTNETAIQSAASVSSALRNVPTLRSQGLSLEGDVARARGDTQKAVDSYLEATRIKPSPSTRIRVAMAETANKPL